MSVVAAALGLLALVCAVPASARVGFERLAAPHSAGTPARYDRVGILKVGPARARNVLVLNPGTSAGAAYFVPLAKSVVARAKGWQVWSVERRENLLEDQSLADRAKAGTATPQQVFDHYLGWTQDSSISPHFELIPDSEVAFARMWGMRTEVRDLRVVVRRARRLGGKVVLGGHSLGGSITTAYATWDFHGRPGARGLSGLVFIDGGSGPEPVSPGDARDALAELESGSPWLAFGGIPAPFAGMLVSGGGLFARLAPGEPSIAADFPLLPAEIRPPVPVTNAAQFGYALDTGTSPASLVAAQAHLGRLAAAGDPRGWNDARELTPLRRFADMFSGWGIDGVDGAAWYHPLRLTIDSRAVAAGNRNPAQRVLDVDATHGGDLPRRMRILAFGAALGGKRVLRAARSLARQSHIPRRNLVLVDRSSSYAHNDPNSAAPKRNAFLRRLVPFLRRIAR